MDNSFEDKWKELENRIAQDFGGDLDVQAILFLIGVQELGKGKQDFTKDQKLDVMHVAICRVLSPFGFYKLSHADQDGWPHFDTLKPLPTLKAGEQLKLMKQGILDYFGEVY
jgi:hypothetical protein|tara:strand:- start:4338 stop:4673 length:336 start_codon:yes stop_codon:yes gene_type:complete